jgi:hypothetical protein
MSRALVARVLLSVIAVVFAVVIAQDILRIAPEVPFKLGQRADGAYQLLARSDMSLPASLHDGDVLSLREMTREERAVLFANPSLPRVDFVNLTVVRADRPVRLTVGTVTPSLTQSAQLQIWTTAIATMAFVFALAMITLWWGHDWAAWGLAAFGWVIVVANGLFAIPAQPIANCWIQLAGRIFSLMTAPALYVMAEALARTGLPSAVRRWARTLVVALTLISIGLFFVRAILPVYYAADPPAWSRNATNWIAIILYAVPLVVLLLGYRDAAHESRLRMRWVLWSTALLFGTIAAFVTISRDAHPYLFQTINALQGVALLGYLYAVLRTRLVDVSFVIDRALVLALLATIPFGIFALLEQGLHHFAVGEKLSWALQAGTAVLLAMALSPLHRRLADWIERLFLHQQRVAVAALKRFAAECGFVERDQPLVSIALDRLMLQCEAAAIYERTAAQYHCRDARGGAWPEDIDVDDPLFVALRARHQQLDLEDVPNSLVTDGWAFPMTVAENLTGAVICRPRGGEQFAADVRAALDEVARNLGMSLYILRYREQGKLVADIATGRIDETAARQRARSLIEDSV